MNSLPATAGSGRTLTRVALLASALIALPVRALECPTVPEVPAGGHPVAAKKALDERKSLLTEVTKLCTAVNSFNANCDVVDSKWMDNYCRKRYVELQTEQGALYERLARFQEMVDALAKASLPTNVPVHPEPLTGCAAVREIAERDRQRVEELRRTGERNQEELEEWKRLNGDAQKEALLSAVRFVAGSYAAKLEESNAAIARLEEKASADIKRLGISARSKQQRKLLAKLHDIARKLASAQIDAAQKKVVKTGLEADQAWVLARETMHVEFQRAITSNPALEELKDSSDFQSAFIGDEVDSAGSNVLGALAEEAIQSLARTGLVAQMTVELTGKTVRAAAFFRDSAYNALLSQLSTDRVEQDSAVAGQLAIAARSLQQRYRIDVDRLRECRK